MQDNLLTTVISELEHPSEKLQSIRDQLNSGHDLEGKELGTIEISLDPDICDAMRQMAADYNVTIEELCWLILEEIFDGVEVYD